MVLVLVTEDNRFVRAYLLSLYDQRFYIRLAVQLSIILTFVTFANEPILAVSGWSPASITVILCNGTIYCMVLSALQRASWWRLWAVLQPETEGESDLFLISPTRPTK